jgi:hypothetical protein
MTAKELCHSRRDAFVMGEGEYAKGPPAGSADALLA